MSTTAAVLERPAAARQTVSPGLVLGVAAAVLAAHVPLVFAHFQQLWLKPHYQLFPLVLAGAFALLWPLRTFSLSVTGPLRTAMQLLMAGVVVAVIGAMVEGYDLPVSPTAIIAAGGIAMFAAIPLALFTGLGLSQPGRGNPGAGLTIVVASWVFLAGAIFFNSPAGGAVSALIVIASIPVTLGGWPLFRRCLPAIAYLFLIIPPPFGLDTKLVQNLQVFASRFSSQVLDYLNVSHNLTGVVIEIGARKFEVANACSGISSLLSTLACVLLWVLWFNVHWLRAIVLTLSAIFWVLMNNILRIVAVTFFGTGFNVPLLNRHFSMDLSEGIPHFLTGMVLFALTLFFLWSTDRLLMFLGRSDPPRRRFEPAPLTPEAEQVGLASALALPGAWYRSVPLAAAFAVLAVGQIAEAYAVHNRVPYSGSALSKVYEAIDVTVPPEKVGPWQRPEKIRQEKRESGNPLGEFSRIWDYEIGRGVKCHLSLDYPYPEFHDLRVCYKNNGWNIEKDKDGNDLTVSFEHKTDTLPPLHCVRVPMHMPVERYATLWFCEFDQDGVGVDPVELGELRARSVSERIEQRVRFESGRWKRIFVPTETVASSGLGSVLQVQLLVITYRKLADNNVQDLEKLFVTAAERLRAKCVELKSKKS